MPEPTNARKIARAAQAQLRPAEPAPSTLVLYIEARTSAAMASKMLEGLAKAEGGIHGTLIVTARRLRQALDAVEKMIAAEEASACAR